MQRQRILGPGPGGGAREGCRAQARGSSGRAGRDSIPNALAAKYPYAE